MTNAHVLVVLLAAVASCSGGSISAAPGDASTIDGSRHRVDSGKAMADAARPSHDGSRSGSGSGSGSHHGAGSDSSTGPDSAASGSGSGGGSDGGSDATDDATLSDAPELPPNGGPPHGPSFAFPVIQDNTGTAMESGVTILTIVASNDAALGSLQAFGAALPSSNWWSAVSRTYNLGSATHAELKGAAITGQNLTDPWMIQYIRQTLTSNGWALGSGPYHGNTVSILYLPQGVTYSGNDGRCQTGGQGYHSTDYITPDNDFIWAVVQRCPPGNIADAVQNTMAVGSHEIAESVTDPVPPNGYILPSMTFTLTPPAQQYSPLAYAPPDGEVGDLCFGTYDVEGSYTYQRIWSNDAAKVGDPCIPASPTPYESATTPQAWYPIQPNGTVTIPVRGWSTRSSSDMWKAFATIGLSQPSNLFTVDTSWFPNGLDNAATVATLAPQAAPTATSGDYGIVYVISERSTTSEMHYYPIGLYVP